MCRYLIALSSLLLLASGCHRAHLPVLPASHGHLSLAVDRQLAPDAQGWDDLTPADAQALEVTPEEAPTVFAEALRVLRGTPSAAEVRQAREDLSAACGAGFKEACGFLRRESVAPTFLEAPESLAGLQSQKANLFAVIIHQCRITTEGWLQDCELVEGAPAELVAGRLRALQQTRMTPARLAGHPIEQSTRFVHNYRPPNARLSHAQRVEWGWQRVRKFPRSVMAWMNLAEVLATQLPLDPAYAEVVGQLSAMAPRYWWAAGERAWLHVEAGRYTEALPLAEVARRWAPGNPYVRELYARVLVGLGRCEEAVAEQRHAVEVLPAEWLDEERERFTRLLNEYPERCAKGTTEAALR